jgi:hypothetical protein
MLFPTVEGELKTLLRKVLLKFGLIVDMVNGIPKIFWLSIGELQDHKLPE